ncbi:hypothetical protein FACS1894203_4320 [Bacteroidia bacterium]|nr:hypothetical protein FACS1894203_4320 [Bacteroidia bacterium]GHT70836.1 hypothetical protein FACS189455_1300 [Bacteroidia bacterium]GHU90135.1 hypothetical protein FACS1894155_08090 [Bacteroidia bacterium]
MKVQNQPYGDQRLYHFGITVGMNFQDMIINNSGMSTDNGETWYAQIPNYSPGFSVGIIADLYMNQYMSLRTSPSIHFGDKSFLFKEKTLEEPYKANIRSNYLTLPVDIKFASRRLNNFRPYFLTGLYTSLDLGRKKGEAILLKSIDYGFEIGFGCDFYLPIVKVCPEIKFCFGLADIIEKNRSDLTDKELMKYTQAISKGIPRMIVVTFNFE